MNKRKIVASAAAGLMLISGVAACSSSKSSSSTPTTGSSAGGSTNAPTSGTIKLGVLTDSSGPAASGFTTTEQGIKAYVNSINATGGINGTKLSYVMGDTASTPAGALTAAQKLVQSDKVYAIIDVSSDFYGAEPYLLKANVPVVGGAFDGPEWSDKSNTNLYAALGVTDISKVDSAVGEFMKSQGVTSCGSIGYGSSPSAQASATGVVKSCVAAGLKNGYLNNQIPFGSTDMGAIALAIKKAGVDGMEIPVVTNTAFALIAALNQVGVKLKAMVVPVGYGGDLLQSAAAVSAAQGVDFTTEGNPVEANTAATNKMKADFASAGVTSSPTFAEQEAYLCMVAFAAGLKAAGANASPAAFATAMRAVKGYDANGILSPAKFDFDDYASQGEGASVGHCFFAVKLTDKTFNVISGTPTCGKTLDGVSTK
jgi:branched-chain amino acid transport system substrate-binding protein